ncbi:MAG: TIGR03435 family protein [Verrucomicrobiia bacterium]
MQTEDMDWLRQFARSGSDEAFVALVRRHVNLVYSVALRRLGNPHEAEEVTQAVFIILARKAAELREGTILSGWLYHTARLTSANYQRAASRRRYREQEAFMQFTKDPDTHDSWERLSPLLEEAMARLGQKERDAVVLRFFENRTVREVANALGLGEAAAQKRVNRATDKLRAFFARRGIQVSAVALLASIGTRAVQAAPAELVAKLPAAAALKGAAAGSSTLTLIKTTLKLMAWTNAKITTVAVVGTLLAAGTATVTVHQIEARHTGEPWQVANISSDTVGKLPPEVKILPTKFRQPGNLSGVAPGIDKFVGIGQPVVNIVWAAYDWPQARTIFAMPEPTDRYDFITTLAQGSREALRQELKNKLGLVGHHETRDMDVLLLKVRNANAPGLHPPTQGGYSYLNHNHHNVEIKWANETISKLGEFLESGAKMPIIDQTGLTGRYSVDIKWAEPDGGDSEHRALQSVLLDQLGLELVPDREPVDMLVVEKTN